MKIPRQHIICQRKFVQSLFKIKFIHYRDLYDHIDSTNFQICTKVDFKAVPDTYNNIRETWGRLRHEANSDYYFKSKAGSEYFIDSDDNVYRFSNHWGAVASCEWTREGEGQLMMSVFETGEWEIGVANLKDFVVFRRKVDRKRDMILNPEWIEKIKTIIPIKKKLKTLKLDPRFKDLPVEDKQLIGENYGFFRKELNELNTAKNEFSSRSVLNDGNVNDGGHEDSIRRKKGSDSSEVGRVEENATQDEKACA